MNTELVKQQPLDKRTFLKRLAGTSMAVCLIALTLFGVSHAAAAYAKAAHERSLEQTFERKQLSHYYKHWDDYDVAQWANTHGYTRIKIQNGKQPLFARAGHATWEQGTEKVKTRQGNNTKTEVFAKAQDHIQQDIADLYDAKSGNPEGFANDYETTDNVPRDISYPDNFGDNFHGDPTLIILDTDDAKGK